MRRSNLTTDAMALPTAFSAPPSEYDVSLKNISDSSASITGIPPAAPNKYRFTPAEKALVNATPALPALVVTSKNIQLRSAAQIQVSSGSEISVASSIERQRRFDLARAKRELAEARVAEAQAGLDLAAGSKARSVTCLDDVRSEGGNSARAQRITDVGASPPQGGLSSAKGVVHGTVTRGLGFATFQFSLTAPPALTTQVSSPGLRLSNISRRPRSQAIIMLLICRNI